MSFHFNKVIQNMTECVIFSLKTHVIWNIRKFVVVVIIINNFLKLQKIFIKTYKITIYEPHRKLREIL